jgi:hypothetical protein
VQECSKAPETPPKVSTPDKKEKKGSGFFKRKSKNIEEKK